MAASFYFYDLETSGINPRSDRIMQFAGQRTDLNLKPIGQPDKFYLKITPDILPEPDAVLITGITPQQTLSEGDSEAEFLKHFYQNIALPDTIFLGFNNIRFDDEFVRYLNYRNFYDAYEWQWQSGRSRWDLLDVIRMTRALRPQGINWPKDDEGKPSNRLTLLTKANNIKHDQAHDALSDVQATIAIADLIAQKQPKLFNFLLENRDKKRVAALVTKAEPFVYSSGRYASEFEKTTVAVTIANHSTQHGTVLVYDLRVDPTPFAKKTVKELAEMLDATKTAEKQEQLPVKQLQLNRCPAVAPLSVLDVDSQKRLNLKQDSINRNLKSLLAFGDLGDKIQAAFRVYDQQKKASYVIDINNVDAQLYDGFFNDQDVQKMSVVRLADANQLADLHPEFVDTRLVKLLLLYKARQFPSSLSNAERNMWEEYRAYKLLQGGENSLATRYALRLNELSADTSLNHQQRYLLEELKLYGESIMPI